MKTAKFRKQTHDFIFQLSDNQERIFRKWYKSHVCNPSVENSLLSKLINSDIHFEIYITKIGRFVKAVCSCGSELDLSNF